MQVAIVSLAYGSSRQGSSATTLEAFLRLTARLPGDAAVFSLYGDDPRTRTHRTRGISGNNIFEHFVKLGLPPSRDLLYKAISSFLRRVSPDLVIVWDSFMLPSTAQAVSSEKTPLLLKEHNLTMTMELERLKRNLVGWTPFDWLGARNNAVIAKSMPHVNLIMAASDFVRASLVRAGIPETKVRTVYLDAFTVPLIEGLRSEISADEEGASPKSNRDTFVVYYGGRLVKEKGVHVLLRAVRRLCQERDGPKVRVVVTGEGPLARSLARQSSAKVPTASVDYLGPVSPRVALRVLAGSDLVVVPSLWPETFGKLALEAHVLGKPVLGSRLGALPEIVRDGRTGFLVEAGSDGALAKAMLYLASDVSLAKKMGEEGRRFVLDKFQPNAVVDQIKGIYREIGSMFDTQDRHAGEGSTLRGGGSICQR